MPWEGMPSRGGRFFPCSFSCVHRVCCLGTTFPESRPSGHGGRVRSALQGASMRRKTVVVLFLLAALLTAPWASAAPRHGGGRPATVSGMMAIPDVLIQAWRFLTGAWSKTGCNIDPDGRCVTTAPLPTKEGCHIDPNGRCVTALVLAPSPQSSIDSGCQIDPNGGRCGL
jgi:hypothetical protein